MLQLLRSCKYSQEYLSCKSITELTHVRCTILHGPRPVSSHTPSETHAAGFCPQPACSEVESTALLCGVEPPHARHSWLPPPAIFLPLPATSKPTWKTGAPVTARSCATAPSCEWRLLNVQATWCAMSLCGCLKSL